MGSDSIVRVEYSADGWDFASSQDPAQNFAAEYVFSGLGERSLLVRGYNATGQLVAEDRMRITVER